MIKIELITNENQLKQAFAIRLQVFVVEQKVPLADEVDQYETLAQHFLVYNNDGEPIATCRIRPIDAKQIKIERVCVLKSFRKLHIGQELMMFVEQYAKNEGYEWAVLLGQTQALKFYETLGYKVIKGPIMDANIEHYQMKKSL